MIRWRDVWIGALIASVLITLGKYAIGLYLVNAGIESSYGAAGALVLLLVWIYYSAQIFLLGAEFTKVFAQGKGAGPGPNIGAGRNLLKAEYRPSTHAKSAVSPLFGALPTG